MGMEKEEVIECSGRVCRVIEGNEKVLEEIKGKNGLRRVRFDRVAKTVVVEGMFADVVRTRVNFVKYFEGSTEVSENREEDSSICGICCEHLTAPFQLQSCQHTFCSPCLLFSLSTSLSDASYFPLKCPHCLLPLLISDLTLLLPPALFTKLTTITLNQFITLHSDIYRFCLTPNCPGICLLHKDLFNCKLCEKTYCSLCGVNCILFRWRSTLSARVMRRRLGSRSC